MSTDYLPEDHISLATLKKWAAATDGVSLVDGPAELNAVEDNETVGIVMDGNTLWATVVGGMVVAYTRYGSAQVDSIVKAIEEGLNISLYEEGTDEYDEIVANCED